jgi:hypothetical protein
MNYVALALAAFAGGGVAGLLAYLKSILGK